MEDRQPEHQCHDSRSMSSAVTPPVSDAQLCYFLVIRVSRIVTRPAFPHLESGNNLGITVKTQLVMRKTMSANGAIYQGHDLPECGQGHKRCWFCIPLGILKFRVVRMVS